MNAEGIARLVSGGRDARRATIAGRAAWLVTGVDPAGLQRDPVACILDEGPGDGESLLDALHRFAGTEIHVAMVAGPSWLVIIDAVDNNAKRFSRDDFTDERLEAVRAFLATGNHAFVHLALKTPAFEARVAAWFKGLAGSIDAEPGLRTAATVQIAFLAYLDARGWFTGTGQGLVELLEAVASPDGDGNGAWQYLASLLDRMEANPGRALVDDGHGHHVRNLAPAIILDKGDRARLSLPDRVLAGRVAPFSLASLLREPGFPACFDLHVVTGLVEVALPQAGRKKRGSFYTPDEWAWFAARRALERLDREHRTIITILDPATGSGAFLEATSSLLAGWHARGAAERGDDVQDMNEFRFTCKRDVIHPALHGIDLDPLATKATRARLFFSLVIHATRPSLRNETLVGTAPPVIHGDFLLHPFSSIFDVIVGNPPYVMEVRGNQDVFRVYSKAPGIAPYYGQKIDVFYLFMFKALDLLVPGGIMAFIVQEYWLDRHHARRLRRRVFEHACTDVISFKEFTVFSSAPGHHSMITTIKKVPPAGELTTITTIIDGKVPTITLLRDLCKGAGNAIQQRVVDAATVYDPVLDKVFAGATNEQSLFAALQVMPSIHLDPDEIQLGINIPQARTRDGAGDERGIFVLDAGEVARLDPTPDEQALLRPFHPATSIQPFSFDMTGGACIIYSTNEVKRAMEADPACYPALARHLESHRDIITSDHGPYGLHRSRQPAWFESPVKIVGVRKTRSPRFAVVPVPWYMDQSGIYIVLREDEQRGLTPGYACAFLNSTTGARILRALRAQGDQLQVDKSVLLKVPFPVVPRWLVDGIDATSTWIHALHATGVSSHASLAARCKQAVDATFQHVVEHGTKALSGLKPVLATLPRVHMTAFTRIETPLPGYPGITRGTIDVDGLRDMVSLHAGTIEQVVVAMEGTARHASSRSSCQTN